MNFENAAYGSRSGFIIIGDLERNTPDCGW